jgi:serine/threonine protein phosphatase PrpC
MCSDGLSDMLDDASIAQVLLAHDSLESCQALIDAANDAGGKDNISVILVRASGGATAHGKVLVAVQALIVSGASESRASWQGSPLQPAAAMNNRGQAWASWWFRSTVW